MRTALWIDRRPEEVFDFFADVERWVEWANLTAVRRLAESEFELDTPRGKATVRTCFNRKLGLLDHHYDDGKGARWRVSARVVPERGGTRLIMVLARPETMPASVFQRARAEVARELASLKARLEGRQPITRTGS